MVSKQKEITDWDKPEEEVERRNLVDIAGQVIHITGCHEEESEKYGVYTVLETEEGEFYSFSKKLQKQYDDLQALLNIAEKVRARVKVSNRQAYLVAP